MSQIEHQCNMTFLLSTDNINTKQHVNANLKDVPLKEALAQMLDGTGISYSFSGNQIVLARHQQDSNSSPRAASSRVVCSTLRANPLSVRACL